MPEYIEREDFYRFLTDQKDKETGAYSKGRNDGLDVARSALHNREITPAADVVEVVQYQEAIKALNEALIMDNRNSFDGENFPCGYRQWCGLCDVNEEHGCAHAYMEWLRGHGERRGDNG